MRFVPSPRALAATVAALGVAAAVSLVATGGVGGSGDGGDGRAAAPNAEREDSSTTIAASDATTTSAPAQPTSTTVAADFVAEPIGERRAIVVTPTETVSLDLAADTIQRVAHGGPLREQFNVRMEVSGEYAFVLASGQLHAVPLSMHAPLQEIGAGLVMLRSAAPGRVWVAREGRGGFVLAEVDAEGRTVQSTPPLPDDAEPHAVMGDEVVLSSPDGVVSLWNWRSSRTGWASPSASHVVAAASGRVVWQRGCSSPLCVLHVLDVSTRADATITGVTEGHDFYPHHQAISPSGRYLAMMMGLSRVGDAPFRLRVIDLDSGLMTESDAFEPARLSWSPDENWLFAGSDGGTPRPLHWAYRVDGLDVRRVEVMVPADLPALAVAIA